MDKVLYALGRFFIGAGLLVFLFIAYQLWGTNISEARNQARLKAETAELFATTTTKAPTTSPTNPGEPEAPTTTSPPNTTPAPPPAPAGAAVAVIKIPKINLEKAVVQGTGVSDLKKGPGHYQNTPLPGQPGNAAIAGHRTTYGAPFGDIGELNAGDEIDVTTRQGSFVYKVTEKKVVSPSDVSVLNPTKDNRLTLTTCHPKYSAAQRLIVTAVLAPGVSAAPAPTATTTPPTTEKPKKGEPTTTTSTTEAPALVNADLSGTPASKTPAFVWAIITTIIGIATQLVAKHRSRWIAYAVGSPFFFIALFIFFENFARLLPANA